MFVFRKIWRALFSCYLRLEICPLTLLAMKYCFLTLFNCSEANIWNMLLGRIFIYVHLLKPKIMNGWNFRALYMEKTIILIAKSWPRKSIFNLRWSYMYITKELIQCWRATGRLINFARSFCGNKNDFGSLYLQLWENIFFRKGIQKKCMLYQNVTASFRNNACRCKLI